MGNYFNELFQPGFLPAPLYPAFSCNSIAFIFEKILNRITVNLDNIHIQIELCSDNPKKVFPLPYARILATRSAIAGNSPHKI